MEKLQNRICYLICVYNDQQGLEASLASIFKDDPLADILVIDDGSTPEVILPEIPKEFSVILHRLKKNAGLIAALNTGLDIIIEKKYDYIARLDAGDTVNQGRLAAQLEYMQENRHIALLGTQLRAFDKDSDKTLFYFNNPTDPIETARTLKLRNCIAHPSVMMRVSAIEALGGYDAGYKYAEDYEMWRRINRSFNVANLPEVYVNKEISPDQITALNRRGSSLSKLKAQIKYFRVFNFWCWTGIGRTLFSLFIPRSILNRYKGKKNA